jgi:hypothetical protein
MGKIILPGQIESFFEGETGQVSDGYHTFDELYEHRIKLYVALCRVLALNSDRNPVWKSMYHSDGTNYEGWFIMGIYEKPGKQITYHLPLIYWDKTFFAKVLDKSPQWDFHTPKDVLERLKRLG